MRTVVFKESCSQQSLIVIMLLRAPAASVLNRKERLTLKSNIYAEIQSDYR